MSLKFGCILYFILLKMIVSSSISLNFCPIFQTRKKSLGDDTDDNEEEENMNDSDSETATTISEADNNNDNNFYKTKLCSRFEVSVVGRGLLILSMPLYGDHGGLTLDFVHNGGSSQLTARYTRTHLYPIAI